MEITITKSNYTFTDVSTWLDHLGRSYEKVRTAGWEFVYILVDGLDQFGRTDHAKMELYELANQQTGLSVKTLQDYASTARKPSTRLAIELGLEKGHAKAVLGLDNDEAEAILTEAAEQGLSVESTRWLARQRKETYRDIPISSTEPANEEPPLANPEHARLYTNGTNGHVDDYEQQAEQFAENEDGYNWADNSAYAPMQTQEIMEPPTSKPHVAHNSGNNEWYTPEEYIIAARQVLGHIDLDPATSEIANTVVQANEFYTAQDDGLSQIWTGKVWMNPPYSSDLVGRFSEKLCAHYEGNDVTEAIALVNNATETAWFQRMAQIASCICFPRTRVKFWKPDGETGAPLQGQAILYFGTKKHSFISAFRSFGFVGVVNGTV